MDFREAYEAEHQKLEHAEAALPRMTAAVERLLAGELARASPEVVALVPAGEPEDQLRWLLAAKKSGLGARLDPEAARAEEQARFDPAGEALRRSLYGETMSAPQQRQGTGLQAIYGSKGV